MNTKISADYSEILRSRFGFKAFKPGQLDAINALIEQQRLLCIQPTGYGKSLLYQLPAVVFEGLTLVISPLLALMRDQLSHLQERFNIPAASINSDQSDEENAVARRTAAAGHLRILFIAPEQLDNIDNVRFLLSLPVDLLVVDEAHCISTWGHDFRPAYRQIVYLVQTLGAQRPNVRVLGLTATANQRTEADIARQLQAPSGPSLTVLRMPMDRPNLRLSLVPVKGLAHKLAMLAALIPRLSGCGILYCATREQTELVAEFLQYRQQSVIAYHAGFDPDYKRSLQQAFIRGGYKAIAATNALGMGIDKPDIRYIIHVDTPGSITAYYQEVGRAGRDGQPARGILLFDEADRRIQDHFIRSAQPTPQDFQRVLDCLEPDAEGVYPTAMGVRVRSGLHPTRVTVILAELVEQGLAEKGRAGGRQVYRRTNAHGLPDLQRYDIQNQVRSAELEAMLRYGRGEEPCLMHALRKALGDAESEPCGRCSRCRSQQALSEVDTQQISEARQWLSERDVPISESKRPAMTAGLAVLNGELRSRLFVDFMRVRAVGKNGEITTALAEELQILLLQKLDKLKQRHRFAAVVPLPSRTWLQRDFTAELIARALAAPVYNDLLVWDAEPQARQGQLLNNDQRKQNVQGRMGIKRALGEVGGALLLLDDYTGSGATLKEAVSVLRKQGNYTGEIVPLTVARVRWRLGARGMI